jgi:amidase
VNRLPEQRPEYTNYDISQMRAGLVDGTFTSSRLVQSFLSRYAELDQSGPTIGSVIELAPWLDEFLERSADDGQPSSNGDIIAAGALGGVPILVKDCFDTTDGMQSTSGSLALSGAKVSSEATAVQRLRAAGALVVGKANMSEWANFRSNRSSSGWSARGGLTRNPHALDRSAGGSSTGSAAAVAAGLVPATLGTETHGSILCPAAACGVVGVKTTVGRVSTAGAQPIGRSQDTVGPIARTVRDAAAVLQVIAGRDPLDPATESAPAVPDYLAAIEAGVQGVRIGVARTTLWGADTRTDALTESALTALSKAGGQIVDDANMPAAADIAISWASGELDVLLPEFKVELNRYLAGRPGGPRNLAELIAFNSDHAEEELRWFGQDLLEAAAQTDGVRQPAYLAAKQHLRRLGRADGIDGALDRYQVDVLIVPTMRPSWKTDLTNGDPAGYDSAASAPSIAGYPAVTVPIGLVNQLPVGLTVMGTAWSEPLLLCVAAAVEAALGGFTAPNYRDPQPD